MLLEKKNAIVCGGAGAMGGAIPRAGAKVFLAGRTLATLDRVASEISAAGGQVERAQVDALDQEAVERHADRVVAAGASLDISTNAISDHAVQNVPLVDMALDDFMAPIIHGARSHFITATAAARRMTPQGSGVIVMLSSTAAYESRHQMGGFNLRCAGTKRSPEAWPAK